MCKESIVLKLSCRWSRYHMLWNGSPSKSFNGSIIERRQTQQYHGMGWGKDWSMWCLTAIRAQIMCLKGLNWVPAVTVGLGIECAWDVRLDSARKHHWVQGSSLQSPCLPPSLPSIPRKKALWPAVCSDSPGGNGRAPAPPLDERSLMAASLKADGPVWGGVSFYFPPACLGRAFVRLPGFAVLPAWWCAKGLKRLSFVLLSNKSWWFTNKK